MRVRFHGISRAVWGLTHAGPPTLLPIDRSVAPSEECPAQQKPTASSYAIHTDAPKTCTRLSVHLSRNGCARALGFVAKRARGRPRGPSLSVDMAGECHGGRGRRRPCGGRWHCGAGRTSRAGWRQAGSGVGGAARGRGELRRVSCRCTRITTAIVPAIVPSSTCAWV